MIVFNYWLSCLIRLQVRAVWVPTARACTTTNPVLVRDLSVSTLVTDVSLLLIMLTGLLRLRRGDKSFFELEYVLWKQVGHCSSAAGRDAIHSQCLTF
jgi:hypothetical protein